MESSTELRMDCHVEKGGQALFLAHDIEKTGIQEKYLKRQLTAQEPLTELDIKRFLLHTGMAEHVHMAQLNQREIGIIFNNECKKKLEKKESYSIPLIINAGSEGSPPYIRWISVVVTVNPLSHHIIYSVNSGCKLTEQDKSEIATTIEAAIQFEDQENDLSAFPGASISSEIKGHNAGRLCGYKALHALYNEKAITDVVTGHPSAIDFKTKRDLHAMKQVIYALQLKAIHLTLAQERILTPQITANFTNGKMKENVLEQQLDFLPLPIAGLPSQHNLVLERISDLNIYHNKIIFPGTLPSPPLTSCDYQQFLLLTTEKFRSSGIKKTLKEMVISCYDDAALEGLTAYNETRQPLPCHTLTLDFSGLDLRSPHAKERFLFNLKTMLLSMSENNLSALTFINNHHQLSDEMVSELAQFVIDRNIAIDITLDPVFQMRSSQRSIDEAVSDNLRQRNIAVFRQAAEKMEFKRVGGEVRKRPQSGGKAALSIDVELQEEQQVEVAVEATTEVSVRTLQMSETEVVIYTMEQFASELRRFEGTVKHLAYGSYEEGCALWCQWTGALTRSEAMSKGLGIKLSKSAIEELIRYYDKFQYGLDLKNLPPGFVYKEVGDVFYIHFDENDKEFSVYNPLQVQTTDMEGEKPLTTALFNQWLSTEAIDSPIKLAWNRLNATAYDRSTTQVFKKLLPQMLLLEKEELVRLFELCFNVDNRLEVKKLKFLMDESGKIKKQLGTLSNPVNLQNKLKRLFPLKRTKALKFVQSYTEITPDFEHHLLRRLIGNDEIVYAKAKAIITALPDVNLNALLQLYVEFGEKGFDGLQDLMNAYPVLLAQLNTHVFSKTKSYAYLLSEEYHSAITAISAFSDEEKAWWDVLLEQHCQVQTDVNLVDMVNAFKAFKKELAELSLEFPPRCELKGVKSLPVALSRILSILKHCKEENRAAQWAEIPKLDLSSRGAIKLISSRGDKEWAFISAEMNITPPSSIVGSMTSYLAPDTLSTDQWDAGGGTDNFEKFFRFVAYQEENGQLPLAFYKHTHHQLAHSGLTLDIQKYLYPLIANATTGVKRVSTVKSLESAITDVDHLITLIIDTPIPGITPERIKEYLRKGLLTFLDNISAKPPLPILMRLVAMISTSLNTVSNAMANIPRLGNVANEFDLQTRKLGSSIFEGMKDYTENDYKNSELFFNYLALVKKITDTLDTSDSNENARSFVSILSTFNIAMHDVNSIITTYFTDRAVLYNARRNEVLNLCRSISMQENSLLQPLTSADLRALLDAVNARSIPVIEIVKDLRLSGGRDFAAYFPEDFLDNYSKIGIPDAVEAMIKEHFTHQQQQSQLRKILLRFSAPGDVLHYRQIVEKIRAITKVKDEIEKTIFIAKLATAEGLYTAIQPLDEEGHHFLELLDVIIAKKSTDEFMTFLSAERNFFVQSQEKGRGVVGLSKKAALYIKTLSPAVRSIEPLAISYVELVPRLQETLLRTPFQQLDDSSEGELAYQRKKSNQYSAIFVELYKKINAIAIENPGSKKQFLELYDRYLQHYSPAENGDLLVYLSDFVDTLEKAFAKITDKTMVLSLCLQFNSDTDEALQPEGLMALLSILERVPEAFQATALKIAVVLINNEKGYTLGGFSRLCQLASEHREFALMLAVIYKKTPFPTLEKVLDWHEMAMASSHYETEMLALYEYYDKAPCHRELEHNGFHVNKAVEQLKVFKGFEASQIDLAAFKAKTDAMRAKSTDELLAIFNTFNPKKTGQYDAVIAGDDDTLVAVAAELLHRSKGKDEREPGGEFVMGSSMELNTTQYLAVLSSLKTPGHVTSQIGTGEGKSRIMMVSIACQIARGKTVDFLTSDAQLATRDFVEYQAYFEIFKAQTSMIFGNNQSLYQIGGINFSDPANLSLFRNIARSLGRGDEVIDPDAGNRALLLDEADKTYFDVADTRFNFSQEGDESIRGMEWVYPLLMKYFAQERVNVSLPIDGKTTLSPMALYFEDIDLSRENFLQFSAKECSQQQLLRLRALSNAQIEQWQVSAVTASQLKFKEDFVIEADTLIATSSGPKISSEAQLLFANRVSRNSKFSFGIHQCLHARLNLARQHLSDEKDPVLREALSKCEYAFYVQDEKQIIYSSTSKNLLDDYKEGTLKAVTGTSGSIIERQEGEELHGLATDKMRFIDVPRHKGLHRTDHALRLTRNQAQQIDVLIAQIKEARAKDQPILVIAENDEESEFLFKKLSEVFKEDETIQHIHSQLSLKEEKTKIDVAGRPGQITVSTDMIGRGTDISLRGRAKIHGLNVMLTYLPKTRDLEQIIGRSGRFGAKGDTSIILDKSRLKVMLGKKKLSDEAFYDDVEKFILIEQALMDKRSQCDRLIKMTVGDFRKTLTDAFFERMLKQVKKEDVKKLLPSWTAFFEKSDKAWNEHWPHLQKELAASPIQVDEIEHLLSQYRTNVQKMWDTMRRNIQDMDVICIDGRKPIDKLLVEIPVLRLTEAAKRLLEKPVIVKYKKKVYDRYDPGHEGRSVEYSDWSIPVKATLTGQRRLFANARAKLEGHGQLFPRRKEKEPKRTESVVIEEAVNEALEDEAAESEPFADLVEPLGYLEEKNRKALDRLKRERVVSEKKLLKDDEWRQVILKLQQVIAPYNFESKGKSKHIVGEQLASVLESLRTIKAKGQRSEVLATQLTQLRAIDSNLKEGWTKKSTLKKNVQDLIDFYDQILLKAKSAIDPMELAEAVFQDENKRLVACSQYPVLHNLNPSWWEGEHLDIVKQLPETYYTEDSVNFLNTIGPVAFDENILKALQTDPFDLIREFDLETLRERGRFLFLLDTKAPSMLVLRELKSSWWREEYIDKLLALPEDVLNLSVITALNTLNPEDLDEAMLKALKTDQINVDEPIDFQALHARGEHLFLLDRKIANNEVALGAIRTQIESTKTTYIQHVSQQNLVRFRSGYYKKKLIELKLGDALKETDLTKVRDIIDEVKNSITKKYGQNWSWFGLVKTTSKSIDLLEKLIQEIDTLTAEPPSNETPPLH